jgi:hypothetical protein
MKIFAIFAYFPFVFPPIYFRLIRNYMSGYYGWKEDVFSAMWTLCSKGASVLTMGLLFLNI